MIFLCFWSNNGLEELVIREPPWIASWFKYQQISSYWLNYAVVVLGKQVDHKNLKGTLTQLNSTNDIPYESNVGEIKFQEKIFPR